MAVVPIACAKCGAPLEISERAKYVTCKYCGSSLQVATSDGARWTELREDLAALKSETARAADASTLAAAAGERAASAGEKAANASARAAHASEKAAQANERAAMELSLPRLKTDLATAEGELLAAQAELKGLDGTVSGIWKEGAAKAKVQTAEVRVKALRDEIDRVRTTLAPNSPVVSPEPVSPGAVVGCLLGTALLALYAFYGWKHAVASNFSPWVWICAGPTLIAVGAGIVGRMVHRRFPRSHAPKGEPADTIDRDIDRLTAG